jgi:hypothetical protein
VCVCVCIPCCREGASVSSQFVHPGDLVGRCRQALSLQNLLSSSSPAGMPCGPKLIQKSSVIDIWKYGNKANSRSANQEVSHVRWGPKVHYRFHKSPKSCFKPHGFNPHHHTILLLLLVVVSSSLSSPDLLLGHPYSH